MKRTPRHSYHKNCVRLLNGVQYSTKPPEKRYIRRFYKSLSRNAVKEERMYVMMDKLGSANKGKGLKIIGAGFGRTGTMSLKAALEELGFSLCYHMTELFGKPAQVAQWEAAARGKPVDWNSIFEGYQATVDWPGCSFYQQLMEVYPEAKVLLTERDPESWYESAYNTIYQPIREDAGSNSTPPADGISGPPLEVASMIKAIIWEGTFGGKFADKDYAITVFKQHSEEVKRRVPPEKLLVYEVKEGWEPLCAFLEVEVPQDKPFPYLNDRNSFAANRARFREQMNRTP